MEGFGDETSSGGNAALGAALTCIPPLAPLPGPEGTLFRVCSRSAGRLFLQLYADPDRARPERTIELDPAVARRGDVWEVFVEGVGAGRAYTWAVERKRPLLDPCALAHWGPPGFGCDNHAPRPPLPARNKDALFKSLVIAPLKPLAPAGPRIPRRDQVIYELHVRGFTRHPSSGARAPGTFEALGERAGYLKDLGITAVELLPVQEFDETEVRRGKNLFNYWGYSPLSWYSPNRRYAASAGEPAGPILEFRTMVGRLHEAGIEVILDLVFNHTAELDAEGPTWHWRDLDPAIYYLQDPESGRPADLSGCGNTVRTGHPTVRALIIQTLRWWVHGLGVDGFRFDLASILACDEEGKPVRDPPLIREIEEDPWLRGIHLIAEAWDAAGGYRVGDWPGGPRWAVWNDRFRDEVRLAWLEPDGRRAASLATRLSGSSDLMASGPPRSLNFITAHDGFTLRDLVSYSRKHNLDNGEKNKDGRDHEPCRNHGAEGETGDPAIRRARDRSRRNLVATLLLAQGVPMLVAGDEFGRSQGGNNNAYCHDGERTWIDWSARQTDAAFHRFVKGLIRLRRECRPLRRERFLAGGAAGDVAWSSPGGGEVDWDHAPGAFAMRLFGARGEAGLLLLINLTRTPVVFTLEPGPCWRLLADTGALPPGDYHPPEQAPPAPEAPRLEAKSLMVLVEDGGLSR